jgi:hypothetical protein
VDQGFVDDATAAFEELEASRDTIKSFLRERNLSEAERKAATSLIASIDKLVEIKDRTILSFEKLLVIYERAIELQSKLIDRLEKRLLKPKNFFEKFLDGVKEILKAVTFIAIGRGLSGNFDVEMFFYRVNKLDNEFEIKYKHQNLVEERGRMFALGQT